MSWAVNDMVLCNYNSWRANMQRTIKGLKLPEDAKKLLLAFATTSPKSKKGNQINDCLFS